MPLPHALLGLINYHPSTGYELKRLFKTSIYFFWNATLPQIYRTLAQMEDKGWVASSMEHRERGPSRRVYAITDAGKKELRRWLARPPEAPAPREPMMIKVFLAHEMDIDTFERQVTRWREYHKAVLEQYEQGVAPVIEQSAHVKAVEGAVPYWRLTLDYGIRRTKTAIEWCDDTLKWTALRKKKKGKR